MGNTPLMGMAFKGYLEPARHLLAAGADPNAHNGAGATALHFCATFRQAEFARLLIRAGADRSATDANGRTPADVARAHGVTELADLLSVKA
jgi:ankyrin repeat protein